MDGITDGSGMGGLTSGMGLIIVNPGILISSSPFI